MGLILTDCNICSPFEEFLSGGTLASRLKRGLPNGRETLDLGRQLVGAVAHIASHESTRDIEPDNILFRADATPVIVVFQLR